MAINPSYIPCDNYIVSEFEATFYLDPDDYFNRKCVGHHEFKRQHDIEEDIFKMFDVYDEDFEFKEDGGISFILLSASVVNVTSVDIFTNFKKVLELSSKFVNTLFIYSIMISDENGAIHVFVDYIIQNGQCVDNVCVGRIFDDSLC